MPDTVTTPHRTDPVQWLDEPARTKPALLSRMVAQLRIIHLWLGVILSPFILFIAVSGIAINHFGGGILKRLHSGKAFGILGRLVVDLVAVGLIVLVLSGLVLWIGPKIIKARKRKIQVGGGEMQHRLGSSAAKD